MLMIWVIDYHKDINSTQIDVSIQNHPDHTPNRCGTLDEKNKVVHPARYQDLLWSLNNN